MTPARPASAPLMSEAARPRRQIRAPCQTTIVGLRPARLARTPKAVRLTSSHMPTPTTIAMATMAGEMPDRGC